MTTSLALTRSGGEKDDSGFSLIELIVAMSILVIAMALIAGLFITFTTNFTRTKSLNESTNVASLGMNEVSRIIRAGTIVDVSASADLPVFVKADREEVILHIYMADDLSDPEPELVRFAVDTSRQLTEEHWDGTLTGEQWSFPPLVATPTPSRIVATPKTKRFVASKLVAPTAAQLAAGEKYLFTYLRADGSVIFPPSGKTALDDADLVNVAAVQVTMIVQADITNRANPVKLQNRVGLPNLIASQIGPH